MDNTAKHKIIHIALLLITLIIAALLRINAFWLPHISNHEFQNLSLALKLDSLGVQGFNLKGVDYEDFSLDGKTTLRELSVTDDNKQGMVLEKLKAKGININHASIMNTPPGLPFLLMLSEKTIGKNNGYFISSTKLGKQVKYYKPGTLVYAQFYAVIIPFVFSLLLVLLTYLLGVWLFGKVTGLIAAFLIATNPVSIFVSQKLWPDEIAVVFLLLSVFLFIKSYKHKALLFYLISGFMLGIATLFAPYSGLIIIGFVLFYYWDNRGKMTTVAGVLKTILNPAILLIIVGLIIPYTVWYFAIANGLSNWNIISYITNINGYSTLFHSNHRPLGLFILLFGIPYLSPLFILSWLSFSKKLRSAVDLQKRWGFAFLFFWIFPYLTLILVFADNFEHRLALVAYPAIALLSAYAINYLRILGKQYTKYWKWLGADELVVIFLIVFARWSYYLIVALIYHGSNLIIAPF